MAIVERVFSVAAERAICISASYLGGIVTREGCGDPLHSMRLDMHALTPAGGGVGRPAELERNTRSAPALYPSGIDPNKHNVFTRAVTEPAGTRPGSSIGVARSACSPHDAIQ